MSGQPQRRPWYEFTAEAGEGTAELHIFGPIGGGFFADEDAITGKAIAQQLDALPDSVTVIRVLVNSGGGSVFDALHIANALRRQREEKGRTVEVDVEALAASAATIITSAGNPIRMPRNAIMMIHNPTAYAEGEAKVMRRLAKALDKVRSTIITTYRWVSDQSAKALGELMDETTWMDAEEALENGLATEITEAVEASATLDADLLDHCDVPEEFRDRVMALMRPTKKRPPRSEPDDSDSNDNPDGGDPMPLPKTKPVPVPDAAAVAKAERERVLAIQNVSAVGITAGLSTERATEIATAAIADGSTLDAARASMFDALAEQSDKTGPVPNNGRPEPVPGEDERDKRVRGICAALWMRSGITGKLRKAAKARPDEPAFAGLELDPGEFRGMSLLDHCRESLERAKPGSSRGKSKMDIAKAFLNAAGAHQTTSDFAVALEEALHKTLLAAYALSPDSWRLFCSVGSVSDFRAHNRYRMGFLARLSKVLEDGEFTNTFLADAEKESITAETYGNILALSRQAIVNDDMGVFSDVAMKLGRAAALSIELEVFELLALNAGLGPAMSDTKTLFHADHNNVGGGAGINVAALDADRVKLASQTDPSGNEVLDLRPAVLVVPIGLGGAARVINQSQFDTEVSSKFQVPNKVVGLFQTIVDTPRMSGTRRYLFADPGIAPVIEVAFLEGNEQPFLDMEDGWRTDGVEWKVRHDFGVAAVDYRGAVTDAGQ
jgi:ATP-dependent protease ClpP protease subunit